MVQGASLGKYLLLFSKAELRAEIYPNNLFRLKKTAAAQSVRKNFKPQKHIGQIKAK